MKHGQKSINLYQLLHLLW